MDSVNILYPAHITFFYRIGPEIRSRYNLLYMLHNLETLDQRLFFFLNGKHNAFFDFIMYWASDPYIWLPLYIGLAVYLYRYFRQAAFYLFFCILLLESLSDQLSSHLIKNWVQRPRPSHVEAYIPYIHLSKAGPGGEYGFVSSHAANSFALALFLALLLPRGNYAIKCLLIGWALLVSYSRIYNGVHYPGDVLGGILLGGMLAFIFHRLFSYFVSYYAIRQRKHPGHG